MSPVQAVKGAHQKYRFPCHWHTFLMTVTKMRLVGRSNVFQHYSGTTGLCRTTQLKKKKFLNELENMEGEECVSWCTALQRTLNNLQPNAVSCPVFTDPYWQAGNSWEVNFVPHQQIKKENSLWELILHSLLNRPGLITNRKYSHKSRFQVQTCSNCTLKVLLFVRPCPSKTVRAGHSAAWLHWV